MGAISGVAIAWLGKRHALLNTSGQITLVLFNFIAFTAGGWTWGGVFSLALLLGGISAAFRQGYKKTLGTRFGPQGWLQLTARLGWPTVLALVAYQTHRRDLLIPFIGAIAAITADWLATELGMLYQRPPQGIITQRPALPGTPGAVSPLGFLASLCGAWFIGFGGLGFSALQAWQAQEPIENSLLWLPLGATLGGMLGNLADSLLGATAQALYYCEACDRYIEEPIHSCGRRAVPVRGWPWMTNDLINLMGSLIGAAITAGIVAILAQSS